MTNYTYKVLLIYPAAEIDGVNAFVRAELDPAGADWVKLSLSASGNAPATHGWCNFLATPEQAEMWLERFADRLGGEVPANFTSLPRDAQRQWMAAAQAALWQASGVYFQAVFNDHGEAPDASAALASCGLRRLTPPAPNGLA